MPALAHPRTRVRLPAPPLLFHRLTRQIDVFGLWCMALQLAGTKAPPAAAPLPQKPCINFPILHYVPVGALVGRIADHHRVNDGAQAAQMSPSSPALPRYQA